MIKNFTFFIIPLCFLGSDLYYSIGRPTDYITIIVLTILFLSKKHYSSFFLTMLMFTILFLSPWLIISVFNGNFMLGIIMTVGLLLIIPSVVELYSNSDANKLSKYIEYTIVILLLTFILQYLAYYIFDYYVDYTIFFGSYNSRGNNAGLFRPHGIFQEPNAYSCAMLSLIYIHSKFGLINKKLIILAYISVFLSFSLWAVLIIPIVFALTNYNSVNYKFLITFLLLSIFLTYLWSNFQDFFIEFDIVKRIIFSDEDSSREARYGGFSELLKSDYLLSGYGFNSDKFQQFGANGVIFIIHSIGIIGVLLLSVFPFIQRVFKIKDLLFIGVLFSSFPLTSYAYFWMTLGLIIYYNKKCAVY
jgi:hypothetical protein